MLSIKIKFAKHFYRLSLDLKEDNGGKWRHEANMLIGKQLTTNEINLFLNDKLNIYEKRS